MKKLQLRVSPKGDRKKLYEVVESGKVLCSRTSPQDYVACLVMEDDQGDLCTTNCFTSPDDIGRNGSRAAMASKKFYALASVDVQDDFKPGQKVQARLPQQKLQGDNYGTKWVTTKIEELGREAGTYIVRNAEGQAYLIEPDDILPI